MRRTGYVRPWEFASAGGSKGGPSYMFMRMIIGSKACPIVDSFEYVKPSKPFKLTKTARASLIGAVMTLSKY